MRELGRLEREGLAEARRLRLQLATAEREGSSCLALKASMSSSTLMSTSVILKTNELLPRIRRRRSNLLFSASEPNSDDILGRYCNPIRSTYLF